MPVSLAESALLSTEESIMATFDFLASENVVDEEAMSDGENDDGLADDDNTDDRLLVRRSKMKVMYIYGAFCYAPVPGASGLAVRSVPEQLLT